MSKNTITAFLTSPQAAAFVVVFVLFFILSPGILIRVDPSTHPKDWRKGDGSHVNADSLLEAFLGVFGGSWSPLNDDDVMIKNVEVVAIHATVAALIAGALVTVSPSSWTKGWPVFKNL